MKPRPLQPRLPWLPLERFLLARFARVRVGSVGDNVHDPLSLRWSEIAAACGVSTRLVARWVLAGSLTETAADRAACRLGVHPTAIWGDDYFTLTDPAWWVFARLRADHEATA